MNIIYGKKLKLPIFPVIPFASNVTTNKLKVGDETEKKRYILMYSFNLEEVPSQKIEGRVLLIVISHCYEVL